MLRRKMSDALERWKGRSRKALLLTGARQVGKSYVIREFGKANYASYYEANLLLDADARDTITTARNAADFINRIALLHDQPLVEGSTLIFIDEIQERPEIVTLLKALVDDGRYSYAFSGSMLGTELEGITSFPVGSVEHHVMRPMDFEEFSWAVGVGDDYLEQVRGSFLAEEPVPGYLHDAMLRNFRAYMVAGGMPEVVQSYVDGGYALIETRFLQSQLVAQYARDISKYARARSLQVRSVFDRIPVQLEAPSHRFNVAALRESARFENSSQDFLWLVNAGVALEVKQATEAKSPLRRTEVASKFKLYQSDTGMLLSRYPQSTARAVYLGRGAANLGGVYENAVAQELAARGVGLWYYYADEVGEVDFLMEGKAGRVVPVEVKSGRKVRSHAALDRLMNVADYRIAEAIVLSRNNLSREGRILYAPIYMAFCLGDLADADGARAEVGAADDAGFTFAPVSLR